MIAPDCVHSSRTNRAERTQLRYEINWASAEQLPALISEGRQHVREAILSWFIAEHGKTYS